MSEEEVILTVLAMMIFAAVGVLWVAMANRRAVREMEHRERLAMIQRGLVPAPETDPLGFEMHMEAFNDDGLKAERWRTAGTLTIGLGLALMILLTFTAGTPSVGFGVGGAFAALGGAFLLNGFQRRPRSRPTMKPGPRPPFDSSLPPEPPPSSLAR